MSDSSTLLIWMAWGTEFLNEAIASRETASDVNADSCVVTDAASAAEMNLGKVFDHVIVADFEQPEGHLRKTELWKWIPDGYDVHLFLDADTQILGDISLGFEKARKYGIAMAPAAHYCLDAFWGFHRTMMSEGVEPRGVLQYNSGVIFFTRSAEVKEVFAKWRELANKYGGEFDQAYLSLAMELLEFRPYVLSPNYNYREMSTRVIGSVRIWHTHEKLPPNLNARPNWWPMRYAIDGKVHHPGRVLKDTKRFIKRMIGRG